MNTQKLKKAAKEKAFNFTKEEIEAIMDEELDKNPDEMDTELVEQCLAVLGNFAEKEKQPAKKKSVNIRKVFLIAAIIALLVAVCVPVGADWIKLDADSDRVQYVDGHFVINKDKNVESCDLEHELSVYGFEDAVYPRALLGEGFTISDVSYENFETGDIEMFVKLLGEDTDGYMNIHRYVIDAPRREVLSDDFNSVKQTNINGVDVFVFSEKSGKEAVIDYTVNSCNYYIWLSNCSPEDALRIAETIK